ncbi:2-oxoglutarate/malate carrier protein [Gracilaria domingensis]|nr:2-oxoglutarate/malate carrier protein [Gracilaria domingensis]
MFHCPATTFTHPIDTVKLRIQLQGSLSGTKHRYNGLISGLYRVTQDEGLFALYNGLSPAILRAATYKTIGHEQPTFGTKVSAAVSSGATGAFVGNPCELIKVRMQQDDIYRYKHVGDGIVRIVREEGVTALWNGTMPAALRAALLTSSQLATYDHW